MLMAAQAESAQARETNKKMRREAACCTYICTYKGGKEGGDKVRAW